MIRSNVELLKSRYQSSARLQNRFSLRSTHKSFQTSSNLRPRSLNLWPNQKPRKLKKFTSLKNGTLTWPFSVRRQTPTKVLYKEKANSKARCLTSFVTNKKASPVLRRGHLGPPSSLCWPSSAAISCKQSIEPINKKSHRYTFTWKTKSDWMPPAKIKSSFRHRLTDSSRCGTPMMLLRRKASLYAKQALVHWRLYTRWTTMHSLVSTITFICSVSWQARR